MGGHDFKTGGSNKRHVGREKALSDMKQTSGDDFPGSDYSPNDRKNWMSGLDPEKVFVNQIVWPGTHDSATNEIGIPLVTRPLAQCQTQSIYHQLDDQVFDKTIAELLPKRVICVWKPRKSPQPKAGGSLWSSGYLKDNWIDTDLPLTKFESNIKYLSEQKPVNSRKYFYRVENTVTPQADNPILCVKPVTDRIRPYARMFISQCFSRNIQTNCRFFRRILSRRILLMLLLDLHMR
ncbi:PLC-like phosphodiesterases superfamily protein [Forsythia ovata]|uniref:PLC-like phosphodiesterases superfamily protein n=1 Tax=Forsythia ovata TaxID=205694 RepID=A0ABD1Q3F5_9LAMI